MFSISRRVTILMSCAALAATFPIAVAGRDGQQSLTFVLTIEGCEGDLGTFSKVTGLDASWDLAEYPFGR